MLGSRAGTAASSHGYRNAQVTVLAPTGTIAFLMDCDTTGVEPDIALVKYKLLAGGGMLKIVNRTVPEALRRLGYAAAQIEAIVAHIEKFDTIEDVEEDGETVPQRTAGRSICRSSTARSSAYRGKRSIHYLAHLKMMAAAQPFISGAISKTVNLPEDCTVEDIRDAYVQAWKMGLKCVAIYRDGSKRSQPLNTRKTPRPATRQRTHQLTDLEKRDPGTRSGSSPAAQQEAGQPLRRRLPETRTAVTHKFDIAGHEGYLTVGLFDDGQPGELFITMAKEGSTIGGLMDGIGTLTSLALQYGVPLEALVKKFAHQRFEPSGFTKNPEIRNASSITDYVFRWLAIQFIPGYREANLPNRTQPELAMPGLLEEVKKKVNRPVPELPISDDDTTILVNTTTSVPGTAPTNGNGTNGPRSIQSLSDAIAHFQQDAPTVPQLRARRRPQRRLLQMPELRRKPRMQLALHILQAGVAGTKMPAPDVGWLIDKPMPTGAPACDMCKRLRRKTQHPRGPTGGVKICATMSDFDPLYQGLLQKAKLWKRQYKRCAGYTENRAL